MLHHLIVYHQAEAPIRKREAAVADLVNRAAARTRRGPGVKSVSAANRQSAGHPGIHQRALAAAEIENAHARVLAREALGEVEDEAIGYVHIGSAFLASRSPYR